MISAEEIAAMTPEQVNAFYSSRISSTVVDVTGKEITKEGVSAEKVEIAKDYKKPAEERAYPVFIFHAEGKPDQVESYIFPMYGAGLWDAIWGYLALDTDMNTIGGITLAHAAETPGLAVRGFGAVGVAADDALAVLRHAAAVDAAVHGALAVLVVADDALAADRRAAAELMAQGRAAAIAGGDGAAHAFDFRA